MIFGTRSKSGFGPTPLGNPSVPDVEQELVLSFLWCLPRAELLKGITGPNQFSSKR